jgi:hypothetical protein
LKRFNCIIFELSNAQEFFNARLDGMIKYNDNQNYYSNKIVSNDIKNTIDIIQIINKIIVIYTHELANYSKGTSSGRCDSQFRKRSDITWLFNKVMYNVDWTVRLIELLYYVHDIPTPLKFKTIKFIIDNGTMQDLKDLKLVHMCQSLRDKIESKLVMCQLDGTELSLKPM